MLYLISTPIGNLGDITFRAIDLLKSCDYILAEDTRKSSVLLKHYSIFTPLFAFHKFNEKKEEEKVIEDLKNGKNIALITDGGTPLISDPGSLICQRCIKENLPFTAIPGPCSLINALLLSGFPSEEFHFFGFLPKKKKQLTELFRKALMLNGISIFFESPQRLVATLKVLAELSPGQKAAVAREMTKKFEDCKRGLPPDLLKHFLTHPPKGEIVLLLEGGIDLKENLPLDRLILELEKEGLSFKEALKVASKLKKIPKREAYRSYISPQD